MAPKPASTAGKAPASTATASKAPAKTTEGSKAAKKTSKTAAAAATGDDTKKKRRKLRKETYSSYIYKGARDDLACEIKLTLYGNSTQASTP
jgi:histone H2B